MRIWRWVLIPLLAFLSMPISTHAKKRENPEEPWLFYPKQFETDDGVMPACTPLRATISDTDERATLEDPNEVWGQPEMPLGAWRDQAKFSSLKECLESASEYKGRYTDDQVKAFSKGQLQAGMPIEFALMVLGPPDQRPSYMSMLNPLTGKPQSFHTYMWMKLNRKLSGLRIFLSVIGTLALGVAGVSDNLGTVDKALDVATVAGTAETISWEIAGFPTARIVTVQADQDKKINMLFAN